MDDATSEFAAIEAELIALKPKKQDPKDSDQLRKLARRIQFLGKMDGSPNITPLRRAWSEKYNKLFPMPDWAPNKWLPLDHENVAALSERHKLPDDRTSVAMLRHSLDSALTVWMRQRSADQNPTSEQVERQVGDAVAAAETLVRKIDQLPGHVQTDLDERLRDYLPDTDVSNFIQLLKDCLPQAAESFLEGKRWLERIGYMQQTGPGRRGTGEAFRQLVEVLAEVWPKYAPDRKNRRVRANKAFDGTLKFNAGGNFVHDAAALLTRGDGPELTPAVLRSVVSPDPHKMMTKMEKLMRLRELK